MKYLVILFLLFPALMLAQQATLNGKVLDGETLKPLPNANIILIGTNIGTVSKLNGSFTLIGTNLKDFVMSVSYVGYSTVDLSLSDVDITSPIIIRLKPKIIPAQTVLVEGSIGKAGVTPLAFSKITQKEIQQDYTVQDVPEYLSELPSTTFYSENGNGIGYNYLSIRGFDQRRISVSINGIPQNDPEDHNVYWLDFPDLLSSTAVIQVQRGAGSGVIGYPAIGGSINIITSTFSNQPSFNFLGAAGSYNTRKYSASFSSGLIDNKYSVYTKLSQILSGGYRNNSWTRFDAYYISAVRYDKNLTTQIDFYGGPIADGLAYMGLPKFAIGNKDLRRANYSDWGEDNNGYTYTVLRRPSEIENFTQPHYELLNEYKVNSNITINSALFLVMGDGFFNFDGSWADTTYLRLTSQYGFHPTQNPQNVLIKAEVDNTQYGWVPRISIKHKNGEFIAGGEFRIHRSIHWGSIAFGQDLPIGLSKEYTYYSYNGGKDIINGFVHDTYNINDRINLLGEIQLAYNNNMLYNEKFLGHSFSVKNFFVNPRFGINYKMNPLQNFFLSFARVSGEPRLTNYYNADESSGGEEPQFERNPDGSFNYSKPLVKPETMNDLEIGSSYLGENFKLTLNLYYMLFDNEIVPNGKLDIYGQPITGNMKSTVHRGIELSSSFGVARDIEIFANATYSDNRILDGKYYIDATNYIDLKNNQLGGFPNFLANFGINFSKDNLFIKVNGRYVGKFYSDNYADKLKDYLALYPGFVGYGDNVNDAYFSADAFISYQVKDVSALGPSKIFLQVNNLFDKLYSTNAIGAEFFPAAERNFIAGIQIGL